MDQLTTTYEWTYPNRTRTARRRRTMWIVVAILVLLLSVGMGLTAPDDAESGDVLFVTVLAPAIIVGLTLLADRLLFAYTLGFRLHVDEQRVLHVERGRRSFEVPLSGAEVTLEKSQAPYTGQLSIFLRPSFWYLTVHPAEGRRRMVRMPSGGGIRPVPTEEMRAVREALQRRAA